MYKQETGTFLAAPLKCLRFLQFFVLSAFFNFLAAQYSMWDSSSATKDQTCTSCGGSGVLTTGPPGKSLQYSFF